MNNQQIAKIITFYRVNYNIHQPYYFLLDGNFIKLLVEKQLLGSFVDKINGIVHAKIKLIITSCILRQLELLGHQFKLILEQARKLRKISCNHDVNYSVDECIIDVISKRNNNAQGYIVCSQDIQLRRNVRLLKNVGIMYFGPDQRVTMQDVHKQSLKAVKQQIYKKLLPQQNQLKPILEYRKEQKMHQKERKKKQKLKLASQLGIELNKKVAKGPNPLSVKKKKYVIQKNVENVPKKKRIRKRKKKNTTNNQQNNNELQKNQ